MNIRQHPSDRPAQLRKSRKADLPSPNEITKREDGFVLYSAKDVAGLLDKSLITLERWRAQTRKTGKPHGPPFISNNSRFVGYPIDEFAKWLAARGE